MRGIYKTLDQPQAGPTLLHVDNDGAICVSNNAVNHARNKHLEEQTWFLREHTDARNIVLQHVPTKENVADLMTKSVPYAIYEYLMPKLFSSSDYDKTVQDRERNRQ